jgi:nitrite reductase (NO-forming)/hydroxylamine reductase
MKKQVIIVFALVMLSTGIVHAQIDFSSIVTDAASYSPGDTVTATATVTNNDGNVKKDVFVDFVYKDPGGATLSTETKKINRINGGKSKSISSTHTLDSGAPSGTYTVDASVRWDNQTDDTAQTTFDVGEPPSPPPAAEGEVLFSQKCIMCHGYNGAGGYAHRSIRGAKADRIRRAINQRSDMNFLSYLSDVEVNHIADYLVTVPKGERIPQVGDPAAGETHFRSACTYCHTIGRGDRVGPDLMGVGTAYSDTWLGAWVDYPAELVAAHAYDSAKLALYPYVMPDLGHTQLEVWDTVTFITEQEQIGPFGDTVPVDLTPEQFEATKNVYFNRCAGCHGLYRTGATGPDIGKVRAREIGTDGLGAILRYGTPAGMGNFGQSGILTEQEITHLAAYLQLLPPEAPPLPMPDIEASWNLIVPVASRPTAPEHTRNWENYVGVILRDAGQVAIFDGDTKEEVVRLNTGFAVHILRSSSTGRYFYAIGRDGLVTLIDLWTTIPQVVATVKGCHDARSVESSKFTGYNDRYVIEGCYWPPQYVVFDGLTLEPLTRVDVPMTSIQGETLPEVRVASIVASHYAPLWVIALKESGYVGLVDYSQPEFPLVSTIATELFLHDGGFDNSGQYFMLAANASNKMVVIDVSSQSFVTSFEVGNVPHPGRGANWLDPEYGWVNATPHIREGKVSVYGADPAGRSDVAWQVVREITLPSAGSLFIKTHPNSPWVLVDMPWSSDVDIAKQVCAISKDTGVLETCFTVAANGKATHIEFNKAGTEIWISDWATDGALIILDAVTLAEITRITGLPTPTGKFNVYNTAHDIY